MTAAPSSMQIARVKMPRSFETERLLIRAPQMPGDPPLVNAAVAESFAELHTWMPWAKTMPTLEETTKHCAESIGRFERCEDFALFLFRKSDGEFIGGSGLHRFDLAVPKFEIGYWCRTSCVGRGYITEAVKGIAGLAFEELGARRVEIMMDARNHRSVAVAERAGFELEGVLRHDERAPDGSLRDTKIYALIR